MKFEVIQFETRDSVAVITLNRPDKLNALTVEMGREVMHAINAAVDAGARSMIITGAGRAFCAGGDLREMQRMAQAEGRGEAFFYEPLQLLNECILLIRRTPIPIIAAVNGAASGGGCNLALACDLVLAATGAKFNQAFVKIGLTPDCGGSFILPRLVGWRRAMEMMMTGDAIGAEEALELGMINKVVPDDQLMPQALALAERLAQSPTMALGRIKELLEASTTNNFEQQLEFEREVQIKLGQTADFREGVAAFIEKRQPRFSGG
jgi:2-(1,2-epoxy-1,2-dihydrophenyl)acetyl-CoA isomerase